MRTTDQPAPNEGTVDRVIRIVIGSFVLSLLYWGPASLWALFGLFPLVSGITGFSPLYRRMGWSTTRESGA